LPSDRPPPIEGGLNVIGGAGTLVATGEVVLLDEINILFRFVSPGDRIITPQVFMTLVGATTVQVGAIAAIIARYLFPGRVRDG
jgi:hypothetical protein